MCWGWRRVLSGGSMAAIDFKGRQRKGGSALCLRGYECPSVFYTTGFSNETFGLPRRAGLCSLLSCMARRTLMRAGKSRWGLGCPSVKHVNGLQQPGVRLARRGKALFLAGLCKRTDNQVPTPPPANGAVPRRAVPSPFGSVPRGFASAAVARASLVSGNDSVGPAWLRTQIRATPGGM